MQNNRRKKMYMKFALLLAPLVFGWGFALGQDLEYNGLFGAIFSPNLTVYMDDLWPSFKWAFIILLVYAAVMFIFVSTASNARLGEEHGTADWADVHQLNKQYKNTADVITKNRDGEEIKIEGVNYNKILSKNFSLSYDNKAINRNSNVLVLGAPGTGKTTGYAWPQLLNAGCTIIDVDPKGEHLIAVGNRLKKLGYDITVLNLTSFDESDGYNPFQYIREEEYQRDIENLVDAIFSATDNGSQAKQDAFWENSAKAVLLAIMYYVYFEYPKASQNFGAVMELKRKACVVMGSPMQASAPTEADPIFDALKEKDPDHIAVRYWKEYASGSSNVKKDVASTLNSKLSSFNNDGLIRLTRFDDMDIRSLGDKKRAVFLVVSDTDTSLNFIVSIFYSQLFNTLFTVADKIYKGPLPVHVEILMDEFFNIKLPDNFLHVLTSMRSRNVSASIIVQSLAQLKSLYKQEEWNIAIEGCDTIMSLGVSGMDSAKYLSELLGSYTLDTKNGSQSKGQHGSTTQSDQRVKRELLDPSEILHLKNDKVIICLRGEQPMNDYKTNIFTDSSWKPLLQYTEFDKKDGQKYINAKRQVVTEFDEDDCELLDDVEIGKLESTYFYVSQSELDLVNFSPNKKKRKKAA
ncbi:MAG: type IV secretory system conjugative DNA transfer family protein [Saccharofermentans sp.]|nr:type IV secretory system conjugative DNA transfer family protein [Saccharofermentans sp.]